jgi:hypothetical protein
VFDPTSLYVTALAFGNRPGLPIGTRAMPLDPDALFLASLSAPAFFVDFIGFLDGAGRSTASFVVPRELLDVPCYAAFVTLRNGAPGGFGSFSNERLLLTTP